MDARWEGLITAALIAGLFHGCLAPSTFRCDELLCPTGTACSSAHGACLLTEQVEACDGEDDGVACNYSGVPDGTCILGACFAANCGNGNLDVGEVCDDGDTDSGDGCSADCRSDETCGNGRIDPLAALPETCDDGNRAAGDGCNEICLREYCGNSFVDPGEACDDGNVEFGDGCSPDCRSDETCGNGYPDIASGNELCDDGNNSLSTDGCDDSCNIEIPRWTRETHDSPPPRKSHAMAYDEARGRVVMFGGTCEPGVTTCLRNDTWAFDGKAWKRLSPQNAPSERAAPMAYDSKRHRMVMFGGRLADFGLGAQVAKDAWIFDGYNWKFLDQGNVTPPSRAEHSIAYDSARDRIVLFGGISGIGGVLVAAVTWEFDGEAWTGVVGTADPPPERRGHAMAYDPIRGVTVLFGGSASTEEKDFLSDTWEYDGSTWASVTVGAPPDKRAGHAMVFDPSRGRVVLVGGYNSTGVVGDAFEWDGSDWLPLSTATPLPDRSGHALAYDLLRGTVVAYGGKTDTNTLDETWTLSDDWTEHTIDEPIHLNEHTMSYDPDRGVIVMFGGRSVALGAGPASDKVFEYDGSRWLDTPATGPKPDGRRGHSMAYDTESGQTIMTGGRDGTGEPMVDTWGWNGSSWSELSTTTPLVSVAAGMSPLPLGGVLFCGAYLTAIWEGSAWVEQSSSLGAQSHSMAYDAARGIPVVAGGSLTSTFEWQGGAWVDAEPTNDGPSYNAGAMAYDGSRATSIWYGGGGGATPSSETWEYDGQTWHPLTPYGSPPGLSSHAMAYHAAARKLVLYGGRQAGTNISDQTWVFRFVPNGAEEACGTGHDGDGDGLIGCDDPDCWGYCTPHCPPASANCDLSLPRCGDGTCNPALESPRLCPSDCDPPEPLCGDHFCEGSEDELSCPGDCPP